MADQVTDSADSAAILAAAEKFIERYGRDAPRQAMIRSEELLDVGFHEVSRRWQKISREAKYFLQKKIN